MRRLFSMASPVVLKATSAGASVRQAHSHSHSAQSHGHSHGAIEKNVSGKHLHQCQVATLVGGATNVFFCVTKLWVGSAGGSVALVADGFHSLTDILADIISYVAISLSRKKLPRCRFPLGIGRLETSGAVIVAAILFFGGVALLLQSLQQCFSDTVSFLMVATSTGGIASTLLTRISPTAVTESNDSTPPCSSAEQAESHNHSHGSPEHHGHSHFEVMQYDKTAGKHIILWGMVGIASASVVCKELLFQWTRRVGQRAGSRVVVANAYHHRADAWSGSVALVGVAGQVMGIPGIDGLAGLVVSLSICKIGYGLFKGAVLEFFDYQNAEEVSAIREELQKFNLRIVRGTQVAPHRSSCTGLHLSAAETEPSSSDSFTTTSISDKLDAVHSRQIRFMNVFLVRHGHQYALHVTLLTHELVPAQQIQEAIDYMTALARRSLPVQDTFMALLVCSNYTEQREVYLRRLSKDAKKGHAVCTADASAEPAPPACQDQSNAGDNSAHSRPDNGDDSTTPSQSIAATGDIINPSLERCIASLQDFHMFTAPIRYNWEERTVTAPSAESCECMRDIESVSVMFKCRLL